MSQFSPFTQALQIGRPQPRQRFGGGGQMPQMGWIGGGGDNFNNPAMQLQMAQNLAAARGQTTTSEQGFGGVSPMQRAVLQAKGAMLSGAQGLDDDDQKELETLRDNPDLPLKDFQQVLNYRTTQQRMPKAKPTHDFDPQPDRGGSVTIPKGQFAGAELQAGDSVVGDQVSLGAREPQPQAPADPIVNIVNSLRGKVPDEAITMLQNAAQAGVSPNEIYGHAQQLLNAANKPPGADPAVKQAMMAKRKRVSDLTRANSALTKAHYGFAGVNSEADFQGNDPDTVAERQAYQQVQKNQQEIDSLNGELEQGYDQPIGGGQGPAQQPHKTLDKATALQFYHQAGNDPAKARQLAQAAGY